MSEKDEKNVQKAVDGIQQRLTEYAHAFNYEMISADAVHAAKVRIIDTLGVLVGGFFCDGSFKSRNVAADMPHEDGATVMGTRMKTAPDMAAFVNATTARYIEMTDTYHWPDAAGGHPSDMITSILAVAEITHASGRDYIAAVVLGYEVYLRISNEFPNLDFDHTMFCCLGTAIASARLLGLTKDQLSHCISMAVVPNCMLRQARTGHQTMWRAAASGQAGRAGVFAALLAQAGMEGPHLPFEGKAGWCDHVARRRFTLDTFGGGDTPFKILDTRLKFRASSGHTMAPVLAAEQIAPVADIAKVERILVEVNQKAMDISGVGEQNFNPTSRESADHSVPFLVAATLKDGKVAARSFNDSGLAHPGVRALMKKTEVAVDDAFTRAHESMPVVNCSRVTVFLSGGERLVGESNSAKSKSAKGDVDAQVVAKFRELAEDYLGSRRVSAILERLWKLEDMHDVATIPPDFVLD